MTGPAIVNILAAMPVTKPSALNSMAGETTAFAKPVIGTIVPAPAIFAMSSYQLSPVRHGAQKDERDGRGRACRVLVEAQLSPAV